MKNFALKFGVVLLATFFLGFSLSAQEKKKEESKMIVKVMKDGKSVLDTTYLMDEDFNKEEIEAMVEGLKGDHKMINIFKTDGEDMVVYDFSEDIDIDSLTEGKIKWVYKDGNKMIYSDDAIIEEIKGGENGKVVMGYNITKEIEGDEAGSKVVYITKKIGDHECEEGEVETEIEIIMGDKEGLHEFHTKEGNVMIIKGDKAHKDHKGNVFIHSGEGHEEDFTWTTDKKKVRIDLLEDGHGGSEMMFLERKQKSQISLDPKGDGIYRLEFNSEELEPIQIQVFDGEGNKLFKKKVKNFYGRFLKDVELSGNETGLYTVRVLQGEKEIIGEFEYK